VDGGVPAAHDDVPCHPKTVGVGRPHEPPVRVAAVELGLDQWTHVDPVDGHIVDVAVDLDVLQPGATNHGVYEVDVMEARLAEVDLLEAAVAPVLAKKVGHRRHHATAGRQWGDAHRAALVYFPRDSG
jgi:hypothetical protein